MKMLRDADSTFKPIALCLTVLTLTFIGGRNASAVTFIASCPFTAGTPGETYILTSDLTCVGTAVTIGADNVKLFLNGKTLTGDGTGAGIQAIEKTNLLISGPGNITNFEDGIRFSAVSNSTISGVRSFDNKRDGMDLFGSNGNRILANKVYDNRDEGILLDTSNGNRIAGNECFLQVDDGIDLQDSDNNSVEANHSHQNDDGIELDQDGAGDGSDNNVLRGNTCDGNEDAGIVIGNEGSPGSDGNQLIANQTNNNERKGIDVAVGSVNNLVTAHVALGNRLFDLFDDNPSPPCANPWRVSRFGSRGGAGAACIQ